MLAGGQPVLALAPMQDVTDLAFWRLMAAHGGPDLYYTEYFRVTANYRLDRTILRSITENPTGRPAIGQIIGNDPAEMARAARSLERHPVAAVDLNLGCPAPVVYRKCAGGGLLREPARVENLLGVLRGAIEGAFTVKTRLGFGDPAEFAGLLEIFSRHRLDLLTVHVRTVREGYGPSVHYEAAERAVRALPCPVLVNGNISSPEAALRVLRTTGARGLMIGRGAIRNPWLFTQIRDHLAGRPVRRPTGREVLAYIGALWEAVCTPEAPEGAQVQRMKKTMNFLGEGVGAGFLHAIRRCATREEFFTICRTALDHDRPMSLDPEEVGA